MSKELDNAFTDVRNAFRLLARYQSRVLAIVNYIKEQTLFTNMWGLRRYCNVIGTKQKCPDNYANLKIEQYMWSWDFLYNYMFEYYFGQEKYGRKYIDMSIIQVSDDGFYKSISNKPSPTDVSTFLPPDESNSYLVFTAGWKEWLRDDQEPDNEKFLHKFLAGSKDISIYTNEKGHWTITKRYPMQRFSSQKECDKVIADFNNLVLKHTGIELFKPNDGCNAMRQ